MNTSTSQLKSELHNHTKPVHSNNISGSTFTLTTAADNFVGGAGNDTFNGTFSNGGTNTFNAGDILNGGGGVNTLNINPSLATAATTLIDGLWVGVSNIQDIVVNTNAGAQTIITGPAFEAAFATGGVDLKAKSHGGAITITMGTFTGETTLVTSSGAGAQTITTGSGNDTVTALTTLGAQTITTGSGNDIVTATTTAGAQIITTGSGNDTVTATGAAGGQTITTGSGNDIVKAIVTGAGVQTIVTGAGNDTITASSTAGTMHNVITSGATGVTVLDTINLGTHANGAYTLNVGTVGIGATAANTVITGAKVGDVIHFTDTATSTVQVNAGQQTTISAESSLAKAVAYVDALASTLAHTDTVFQYAHNTYVLESVLHGTGTLAAGDGLIELVGVHTLSGPVAGAVHLLT